MQAIPSAGSYGTYKERDARSGYREWAETYNRPGNQLIALEETVVGPLLARLPAGKALDVAAGTGRHASKLAALGHRVTAVDASAEMLAFLGMRDIGAVVGDMGALPLRDAAFDLALDRFFARIHIFREPREFIVERYLPGHEISVETITGDHG